ncbi:hypothetical protein L4C36_05660 [Photobacterium japonica]|uniref:hypothetical protein n=1 Tax=Photobacterium japonica TaxID=2910235 RepID=UPI003D14A855
MLTFNHDFALHPEHTVTSEEPQHLHVQAASEKEVQRQTLLRSAQIAGGLEG